MFWFRSFWESKNIRGMMIVIMLVFLLTCITLTILNKFLEMITRGSVIWNLEFLHEFYQQSGIGAASIIWYSIAFLLAVLGWLLCGRIKNEWVRGIFRTAWITLLLAPSVFVDTGSICPPDDIWRPGIFSSPGAPDSLLLPGLVCVFRYAQLETSVICGGVLFVLSWWLIPVIWFIELLIMFLHKVFTLAALQLSQSESTLEEST